MLVPSTSPPRRGFLRRRAFALALVLVPVLATGVAYAAYLSRATNTSNSITAGSVALSDNDSGTAMLSLSDAPLGATDTSCIRTTYNGTLDADVRHHAEVSGSLKDHLTLKVTRGSGAATFDSCAGFTADSANYVGAGAGVIYDGKLADYPTSYAAGVVDPSDGGSAPTYSSDVLANGGLVNYWRLGEAASSTISNDTMSGSAGTTLQSHSGETGATWTKLNGADSVLTDANRLRKNGTTDYSVYYASATPSSADYTVEADVVPKSIVPNDAIGVAGRINTSSPSGTMYLARYETADESWNLIKYDNGTITWLDYIAGQTLTPNQSYRLKLTMNGSSLQVYVDGALKASATDATITAPGRAGVRLGQNGSAIGITNTTGLHIDDFTASQAGATAVDSKGSNDGTYSGGVTLGAGGALPGDADRAAQFDGVNDYVTAARQVSDDLSIEFWFKSTQGIGTDPRWTQGAGLVDANITGTNNDFGTSLRSDGRVVAGVGNPDTSIVSSAGGYNDGEWHHVVFTRRRSTGAMALYVDGTSAGSATNNTNALTATASINLGRLASPGNYFAGTLDEVAIYDTVLSSGDVAAHHAAAAAVTTPEVWSTSESHDYRFQITLGNDSAALGQSATATFHWEARSR